MEYQKPADGILQCGDAKFYSIDCACGDSDHKIDMYIEANDAGVTVNFSTKVKTPWWDDTWRKRYDIENELAQHIHWFVVDFANGLVNHLKLTWKIWIHGYVEYSSCSTLSPQQAHNMTVTMNQAIDDVIAYRTPTPLPTSTK